MILTLFANEQQSHVRSPYNTYYNGKIRNNLSALYAIGLLYLHGPISKYQVVRTKRVQKDTKASQHAPPSPPCRCHHQQQQQQQQRCRCDRATAKGQYNGRIKVLTMLPHPHQSSPNALTLFSEAWLPEITLDYIIAHNIKLFMRVCFL